MRRRVKTSRPSPLNKVPTTVRSSKFPRPCRQHGNITDLVLARRNGCRYCYVRALRMTEYPASSEERLLSVIFGEPHTRFVRRKD